jgi:hypothetical protein
MLATIYSGKLAVKNKAEILPGIDIILGDSLLLNTITSISIMVAAITNTVRFTLCQISTLTSHAQIL